LDLTGRDGHELDLIGLGVCGIERAPV